MLDFKLPGSLDLHLSHHQNGAVVADSLHRSPPYIGAIRQAVQIVALAFPTKEEVSRYPTIVAKRSYNVAFRIDALAKALPIPWESREQFWLSSSPQKRHTHIRVFCIPTALVANDDTVFVYRAHPGSGTYHFGQQRRHFSIIV